MATVQKKGRVFFIFLFFIGLASLIFLSPNIAQAIGVSPATSVVEDVLVNTSQTRRIRVSRVAGEEIRSFTVTKKGSGVDLINLETSRVIFEGDEMAKDVKFTVQARSVSPGSYNAELIFTPDNFAVRSSPTSTQAVVPTVTALIKITVTDKEIKKVEAVNSLIRINEDARAVFSATVENKGNSILSFDSVRIYTEDQKHESVVSIRTVPLNPGERDSIAAPFILPDSLKNIPTVHFDLLRGSETILSRGNASLIFAAAQAQPKKGGLGISFIWLFLGVIVLAVIGMIFKYIIKK